MAPLLVFSPHDDYMRLDDLRPTAGPALSVLTGVVSQGVEEVSKG